jgi:uncharacterized protein HemX
MGKNVAEVNEIEPTLEEAAKNVQETGKKALPPEASNEKPRRSKSGLWFGIIILLLVLALAGGGFFLLQQLRDKQQDIGGDVNKSDLRTIELTKQITGYQSQISALQSQIATFDTEITGKDKFFNDKLENFSKLHQEKMDTAIEKLTMNMAQVQRQLGKTRGDWLIADAEYLLSIANQRLLLVGDINTTKEALIAADQRLRESGDAAAYKIRGQIAKEIALLKNVQTPDIVGIYSTIQLLSENVEKLTTFLPHESKDITPDEPQQEVDEGDKEQSQGLMDSAMAELEKYVTIRHTEQPILSIITPEEARFIKEELKVKLEMIKLSLVQQNDALFKSSIADAKKWLAKHFTKNKNSKNFTKELDILNGTAIRGQFPDISQSLKMLRDIVKLRIDADKPVTSSKPKQSDKPQTPKKAQK